MTASLPLRAVPAALLTSGLLACGAARAVDYGPLTLNGFAKAEFVRVSSYCPDCQVERFEARNRYWADEVVQGKPYGAGSTHVVLVQPYLGVKFDGPSGLKVAGLLSQRWRDGKADFKGFWYDRNVSVSHADWGSVRIGAMTTRSWSMADYPFGSNIGLADAWGSSGAGYGLLTRAVRVTTRPLDVLDSDLVLEVTHDPGKAGWHRNKPSFTEVYAQYHKGDLVVDAMLQASKNGTPSAFGHGPFTGLTPFPADDDKLGSSSQGIAMVMARLQVDGKLELSGGVRFNRWSGAWATITGRMADGRFDQWNNMFNVDWSPTNNACPCKGYPATSTDIVAGARYRLTQSWSLYTGFLHLGAAATANPTDRGQSNSATHNTFGVNYDFRNGLQVYGLSGLVRYARKGLAPLSMPANYAFTNIDSRLEKSGNWFGAGAVYAF